MCLIAPWFWAERHVYHSSMAHLYGPVKAWTQSITQRGVTKSSRRLLFTNFKWSPIIPLANIQFPLETQLFCGLQQLMRPVWAFRSSPWSNWVPKALSSLLVLNASPNVTKWPAFQTSLLKKFYTLGYHYVNVPTKLREQRRIPTALHRLTGHWQSIKGVAQTSIYRIESSQQTL